jgi:dTDP-L-rhamnose 4-epimerase
MYQVDRYVDVNTRGTALLLDILVNAKHSVEKVSSPRRSASTARAPTVRDARRRRADDSVRAAAGRSATGNSAARVLQRTRHRFRRPKDKALYRDNIYSMTKYHQEEMVLLIGKTYGIPPSPRASSTSTGRARA